MDVNVIGHKCELVPEIISRYHSHMAKLSKKEVLNISILANLKLTDKEISKLQNELTSIISFVDELGEVDTSDVLPTSQTTGLENKTRADDLNPFQNLTVEQAVSGNEQVKNDYFVVPMILTEKNSSL